MSIYCKQCGTQLQEGTKYCKQCGTQVTKVCAYCGVAVPGNAPFCNACGAVLKNKGVPPEVTASVKQAPGYSVPASQPQSVAPTRKNRATVPILSVIAGLLAVAVLFVYVLNPLLQVKTANTSTGSSEPGLSSLEGAVTQKAVATIQAPAVVLHGLTIDVGTENLQDGDREITVTAYDEQTDEETGCLCSTYDIDVGGKEGELLYPVRISLPVSTAGECLTHYEEEFGLWIPLESERSGDTLTASLTSFSPVRLEKRNIEQVLENTCYYIDNADALKAKILVSSNYRNYVRLTSEQAYAIVEDFNTNGNIDTSFPVGSGSGADFAWKVTGDTATAKTNSIYTVGSALTDLGNTFLGGSEVFSKKLAAVGLLVAVAQLWEDVRTEGFQSERTATNLMKNLCTNVGSIATLCNVGTAALSIGMLAVIGTGIMLDAAGTAANNLKENTMADIFNNYLNDPTLGGFTPGLGWDNKWFNVFEDAYYTAWQSGQNVQDRVATAQKYLEGKVDEEAERICTELLTEGSDSISIAVGEAGKYNFYPPVGSGKEQLKEELRAELKAKFKARVYTRLNEHLPDWMGAFLRNQLYSEIYSNLYQMIEPFNKSQNILVQEIPSGSAQVQYSGYTVRFVIQDNGTQLLNGPYHDSWCGIVPETEEEWTLELDFTYLGYCLAGRPNALALFPPGADSNDLREAERIVPFVHAGASTVVDLSAKDNEFAGVYEGSVVFNYDLGSAYEIEGMALSTPDSRLKVVIDQEGNADVTFDSTTSYNYSLYGTEMTVSSVSHGELQKQPLQADGMGEWGPEYTLKITLPVRAETSVAYSGEAYGGSDSYSDIAEYSLQVDVRVLWIDEYGKASPVVMGLLSSDSSGQKVSSDGFTLYKTN